MDSIKELELELEFAIMKADAYIADVDPSYLRQMAKIFQIKDGCRLEAQILYAIARRRDSA